MYYNNNTAQHSSLLRNEIIEKERNWNAFQRLTDHTAALAPATYWSRDIASDLLAVIYYDPAT